MGDFNVDRNRSGVGVFVYMKNSTFRMRVKGVSFWNTFTQNETLTHQLFQNETLTQIHTPTKHYVNFGNGQLPHYVAECMQKNITVCGLYIIGLCVWMNFELYLCVCFLKINRICVDYLYWHILYCVFLFYVIV